MEVRGEVVGSTGVRYLGDLVGIRWCGGGHGSELCWRMTALICEVHALITIDCCVSRFVADLANWTRARALIPRLRVL